MRKLATIRKICAILPIEGADAIELAVVSGWKVVIKKGEYKPGDLAVYCEIDSWVPSKLAAFLSKGKEPREFEGIKGERLRTIKLRGQLSQGLLLKPDIALPFTNSFKIGDDVSEVLGIVKWEMPLNAQLVGVCKGNFPSLIPKTDQERVQNLKAKCWRMAIESRIKFEVTEKLEGSSMTCYLIDNEFGVCSRNMDLERDERNSFWEVAIRNNIEELMRRRGGNFAIQGELIGPGIHNNIYKLSQPEFFVFDVYNVRDGKYFSPDSRREMISSMGLNHVPVIAHSAELFDNLGITDIDGVLTFAEGISMLFRTEREGVVFKQETEGDNGMTFKGISNKYLLGEK